MDKKNWNWLSRNQNAIHILEKNPDEIYWDWLSENSNAVRLLEEYSNNTIPLNKNKKNKIRNILFELIT